MSAMERVDILETERQDFYMYVDEFQNFAVESFASILSEARKYRLNLIMAHQYIEQLTEEVRDAVFGNIGTIISFRVGGPDAAFMEEEFMPRFTPNDMINLPKFHIYLKLMIDGITSQPFSAITLHPIATRTGSEQKVIAQSRERYAGIRSKIEEKVTQWSGFGADVDIEAEYAKTKQIKKDAKKARFSHEYTCTRCGKVFQLPVELDRSRPIYCEECHPIVMEERQKGKNKGQDSKARREETKKVIEKVPKIDEGEIVEKKVDENSIKLVDLVEKKEEAVKDGITQQVPIEKMEPVIKAIDMLSAKSEQTARREETVSISDQKMQGDQSKPKRKRRRRKRKQVGMVQEKQNAQVSDKKEADSVSVPKPVLPGEKVTFD
jgi:DNA-directed RNA polymerase subunit RPC12/RpoP